MVNPKALFTTLFLLFSVMVVGQDDSRGRALDQMIVKGMADWQIPGLTAVVVKDNDVVFRKVYGVRSLETKEAVDENTLFSMASTTKAIVCMALGILVDQGKISWEDKVEQHLPDFSLSDAYITREARIKDLLTHNLGINGADLLWAIDSVSTKETLARFSKAEKGYPVRGGYAYNNLMYAVAGEVIEAVSGQHWTSFVEENILDPLDMSRTSTRAKDIYEKGNYAMPYYHELEGGIVKRDHTLSDQIGAAGMMWSCVGDISNYLKFIVNKGVYETDTILKPATFNELFKPQALVTEAGFYPTQKLTKPNWTSYGLGWFQHDYRGEKLDFHTGSLPGLIAIAGVMHDKNVAVYVFANMDHAELRHAILYKAMDLFAFNDDSRDWHKEIFELYDDFRQKSTERNKEEESNRIANTKHTLSLKDYTGNYHHEMLGQVEVREGKKGLELNLNGRHTLNMEHWHYDTFRSDKDNRFRSNIMATFYLNDQGKMQEIQLFGELFEMR